MDISAIGSYSPGATAAAGGRDSAASALTGEDFFSLLITQLSNQDPLEPTSNEELIAQISSIRDIELSTQLTESLAYLTEQQRFGSASSLLGHKVATKPAGDSPDGQGDEGLVVGVRFGEDGQVYLQLDNGRQVALEEVQSVSSGQESAQSLLGKLVSGVDASDPEKPVTVEGIVMGVRRQDDGSIMLELDTGEDLPLSGVLSSQDYEAEVGG